MHDIVIRGGEVVDGTGAGPVGADVAIDGDRIVAVGDVADRGRRELDADGRLVTPGFVDIHTHLDAQLAWDPVATSSCWHGVTSVVLGNCGVTFAPVRPGAGGLPRRDDGVGRGHPGRHDPRRARRGTGRPTASTSTRSTARPRASTSAAWSATAPCATYVMGERASTRRRPATTTSPPWPRSSTRRSTPARSGSRRRAPSCTRCPTAARCRARSPPPDELAAIGRGAGRAAAGACSRSSPASASATAPNGPSSVAELAWMERGQPRVRPAAHLRHHPERPPARPVVVGDGRGRRRPGPGRRPAAPDLGPRGRHRLRPGRAHAVRRRCRRGTSWPPARSPSGWPRWPTRRSAAGWSRPPRARSRPPAR